jgi:hypothetical protein
MLSVVPDIHADADRLRRTIATINPGDMIVFLGDLIDAGAGVANPSDRDVLEAAEGLITSGRAIGVMGNHELNAIQFHWQGSGGPLRPNSKKNRNQHQSFIEEFGISTPVAERWTKWFLKCLPLWRDIDGLRVTHAYWGEEQIRIIADRRPNGLLAESDIPEITEGKSQFAKAVKMIVSGPELRLPDGYRFTDIYGYKRDEVRIAWWEDGDVLWKEAALSVSNPDELPEGNVPVGSLTKLRPAVGPVLFGHYKISGEPRLLHKNTACLDFPQAPCFYRWRGEDVLTADNMVRVL